ncbi:sulfotransferase [Falsirhodobacter xinxiangensis]|uniref:sulfotransferase n=1 Tax=Falsirhodobacter xinxiangensis TaxID=2530049 RepID=UPI00145A0FA7|nr:sulfotransferase [Rhodobacter xinxiangensis]
MTARTAARAAINETITPWLALFPRRAGGPPRSEDRQRIAPPAADRPVLVTSLARSGTTLLDVLTGQEEFAAPTRRHMPLALSPMLWGNLARSLGAPGPVEEVAWMAFWKAHYAKDHIRPWTDQRHPEFEAFLRRYMVRVVAGKAGASRYISGNPASLARLPWLRRALPDAAVVIPLRDPFVHAHSLLGQHRAGSQRDPAAAFRPLGGPRKGDPMTPEFWLSYWADTYRMVLETAGSNAILVDQDALCSDPRNHLPVLADALDLADPAALAEAAPRFRPPRAVSPPESAPAALIACVHDTHAALKARCLRP